MTVCVLAGGSGGAKLARGLLDVADDVVVVANTGDDVEIYGAYVSPDPDLVSFSLLDRLDPRGWGLRDDTFAVMDGLREIGVEVWFNLGDRDLAYSIERRRMLDAGERLTEAQLAIGRGLDLPATVLPMSDDRVRTRVRTAGAWHDFQEFMIRLGGAAVDFDAVEGVELVGIEAARVTPEVAAAVGRADAIVIGPSNPVSEHRTDPARAGNERAAARRGRSGRGGQPDRGRGERQGPDDRLPALGGRARDGRRRGIALRRRARRARGRRAVRRAAHTGSGHADGRRRGAAAGRRCRAEPRPGAAQMTTVAVLPIKAFAAAKQRLAADLGEPQPDLAERMAGGVLDELIKASGLERVLVVTRDPAAVALAAGAGADVVDEPEPLGHSAAASLGVRRAIELGAERVLLAAGDCPLLSAADVDDLLARHSGPGVVILADRHGTGTNGLLLAPPDALAPAFGPGSAERHAGLARAAGVA